MRRNTRRNRAPGRTRGRARRAATIVTIGAVVAAGAAVAVMRIGREEEASTVAAPVLEVATATEADLSGTATVSGVVGNASTIDVLHLIDGVTASAPSAPSESTQASVAPAAFASVSASESDVSAVVPTTIAATQPTTTTSTTSSSSTTTTTTTPTEPPTTTTEPPGGTTTTSATTSTTTGSTDTTTTTEPAAPSLPSSPTTTIVVGEPSTTSPSGPNGRPSGASGGGGVVGTDGGSLGATASADETAATVTERITSLPALGTAIDTGDVLYSVDGTPVVALSGELPAWRTMSIDSDDGADITQLEESLVALGYGADLTVDADFDSATAAAVQAWQAGIGVEPSGDVPFGTIVFVPAKVTVTAIEARVGDDVTSGDLVMSISASTQHVVVDLTAEQISLFAVGQDVSIEADGFDGQPIAGVVTTRRSVTSDEAIGAQATITPSWPMGVVDGVSVDVIVEIDSAADITAAALVPAEALLSRLDGTYAVQVRQSDGSSQWIIVDVVQFSGASVAIAGAGVVAGIDVLVPA